MRLREDSHTYIVIRACAEAPGYAVRQHLRLYSVACIRGGEGTTWPDSASASAGRCLDTQPCIPHERTRKRCARARDTHSGASRCGERAYRTGPLRGAVRAFDRSEVGRSLWVPYVADALIALTAVRAGMSILACVVRVDILAARVDIVVVKHPEAADSAHITVRVIVAGMDSPHCHYMPTFTWVCIHGQRKGEAATGLPYRVGVYQRGNAVSGELMPFGHVVSPHMQSTGCGSGSG